LRSIDYAKHDGRSLNYFVTINFDLRHTDLTAQQIFSKINRAKNRWLQSYYKKNGLDHKPPCAAWVFEMPQLNEHVHWLINLEPNLIEIFEKKLVRWLQRYQRFVGPRTIKIEDVNPHTVKNIGNYMVKGVDPRFASFLHLQNRICHQGIVRGQRCRSSQSIGVTARKRAGFNASLQRNEWEEKFPELAASYPKPKNWSKAEVIPQVLTDRAFPKMSTYLRLMRQKHKRRAQRSTNQRRSYSSRKSLIARQLGYGFNSVSNPL
jgi:REP element-mobilizing transposase RayT